MEKRRGASISVKMIATSTLLILMIVALFGILNIVNTSRVFDEQGKRQSDAFVTSLQKRGSGKSTIRGDPEGTAGEAALRG